MGGSLSPIYPKYILKILYLVGAEQPRVCIETGTYQGRSTERFSKLFSKVHTIELSEKWYEFSRNRLEKFNNIVCHYGDGPEILTKILVDYYESVFFFLDSHYSGGDTAFGKEEVPLLRELEIICKRNTADIIVIDDLGFMGESGWNNGGNFYSPMKYDWRNIEIGNIKKMIGPSSSNLLVLGGDRVLIFRNQKFASVLLLRSILFLIKPIHFVYCQTKKLKNER